MMGTQTRYSIGIDLGTTNTTLSYVDNAVAGGMPVTFGVTQVVAPGETMALPELPSFIYLPLAGEFQASQLALPWQPSGSDMAIGSYARDMASASPDCVVSSSKSWLCSALTGRRDACLPAGADGDDGARMVSPVEAATMILKHLRDNWNWSMAREDRSLCIENQDVVITVPASFDAVARELTCEAATAAGLSFTLLEEPQAAFYAWLAAQGDGWRKVVGAGDVALVCDIGGGTTDFSLIAVVDIDGDLTLQRLAVGDHTLLGGDNMDLALAVRMSAKLSSEKGVKLTRRQFTALVHECRKAKEKLGGGDGNDQPLTILGTGSGLVAGTIRTKLSLAELQDALAEGFFPLCGIGDKPVEASRSGMRSMSLEYAADPAFTRHLAAFLDRHSFKDGDGNPILPGFVLFNGGVMTSPLFRGRILDALSAWGHGTPAVLEQPSGDMAVSRGAAWFAHVRQAGGIRIKAGASRSYYIGVESPMPAVPGMAPPLDAVCVVSQGMEEGTSATVKAKGLALLVGEPTEFRFFCSTTRPGDAVGDRIEVDESAELTETAPLTASLPSRGDGAGVTLVPVRLRTELTDIGTLQLWCDDVRGGESWKLEYSIRSEED